MIDDIEDAVKRFETVHLNRGPDEQRYGELAQVKNENYHLKLALDEKNMELQNLKQTVQRTVFTPDVQKQPPTFAAQPPSGSVSHGTDVEVVSNFSGSPYKGKRTNSKATESSVATTSASQVREEHEFFNHCVVPFIEKMIAALKLSSIFKTEGQDLEKRYNSFERKLWKSQRFDSTQLTKIFNDVLYYHQQTTAVLNRELKFKEFSQRLEYLFSVFLDPREYNVEPQDHIENLREEITDTLIRIFQYDELPYEKECIEYSMGDRGAYFHHPALNRFDSRFRTVHHYDSAKRIKRIEQGFDICAHAMNQAFGDKQELRQQDDSIPSVVSSTGMISEISENAIREKDRLKESKSSLEFMPIGYDENVLNSKTPQRKTVQEPRSNDFTPKANDENDPLQMFFQEQASYYDNTLDRRRK